MARNPVSAALGRVVAPVKRESRIDVSRTAPAAIRAPASTGPGGDHAREALAAYRYVANEFDPQDELFFI